MTHQRSEAIQKFQSCSLDCFVAALLAMTHQRSEASKNASRGHWMLRRWLLAMTHQRSEALPKMPSRGHWIASSLRSSQ
jgi:hypothetical protein